MDTSTIILIYRDTDEEMSVFVFTGPTASADSDAKAVELVAADFPGQGISDLEDIRALEEEENIAIDFFGIEDGQAQAYNLNG